MFSMKENILLFCLHIDVIDACFPFSFLSAITLIALALERVKSKIKLLTSKKSAEVLMSVAEGIHLQLQNAESHIQRDVYVF